MKTIGRVFIILAVFSVVVGLMVTVVNASGANAPDFGGSPQFHPNGGGGVEFRPPEVENRPERNEGSSHISRMMFGIAKNIVVIGTLVTAIALPKSFFKNRKKRSMHANHVK